MAEKKDILYKIQVDGLKEINSTKEALKEVNKEMKNVDRSTEDGAKAFDKLNGEQAELQLKLTQVKNRIKEQTLAMKANENSLEGMRAKLALLVSTRNGLPVVSKEFQNAQKEILELNKDIKTFEQQGGDFRRNVGNYEGALDGLGASINGMRDKLALLVSKRNGLPVVSKEFKKTQKEILELNKDIKTFEQQGGDFKKNVGNYEGALDGMRGSIDGLGTQLMAFVTNPLAAAALGLSALSKLYVDSTLGARDLKRATAVLDQVYKDFGDNLARLVGSGSGKPGLLETLALGLSYQWSGVSGLVRAGTAGALAEMQENLKLLKLTADRYAKERLLESESLRRIRDDETLSFVEREKAAIAVNEQIEKRKIIQESAARTAIISAEKALALDKDNLQKQIQLKQAQFELSDVLEDNNGKITEGVMALRALRKENADFSAGLAEIAPIDRSEDTDKQIRDKRDEHYKLLLEKQSSYYGKAAEMVEQNANDQFLLEQQINEMRLSAFATFSNALTGLFEKNTIANKIAANADALINTYLAASQVLKNPLYPDPISKGLAVGATIAQGLALVKQINSPSKSGGVATNRGIQLRTETNGGQLDPRLLQTISDSLGALPPPQVSVTDINNVQNRVRVKDTQGSL